MDLNMDKLQDALGEIRDDFLLDADAAPVKKADPRRRWGALAACLCLIAAGALALWRHPGGAALPVPAPAVCGTAAEPSTMPVPRPGSIEREPVPSNIPTPHILRPGDEGYIAPDGPTPIRGLEIPAKKLPEDTKAVYDMIGLVVYRGGIYTQGASYEGEKAREIDGLVGEYLGHAKGNLDEWSRQDDYAQEFASTYYGDVYAVKGYDTGFRICLRVEWTEPDGSAVLWILFLDRFNGITVVTGSDIFEDRLHLQGRVTAFCRPDAKGGWQETDLASGVWDAFLAEADAAEFRAAHGAFWDEPARKLLLRLEDGTEAMLVLYEGGRVCCGSWGKSYYVSIPGEAFEAVFAACGDAAIRSPVPTER